MAESFSVKAILSAADSGFTSTFRKCANTLSSFASTVKSGVAFGFLSGVGQQAFSSLTSGVSGLISEIDSSNASWKNFEANLSMLNWDSSSIKSAKSELQDFAQKTVYSSSDMATTFSQLAAVGVKNTSELVKGFGGLAAASENPQQAMKSLSQQATQMAAKPKVAWEDFKIMLEQSPAGMAAVAKAMGMSTTDLVSKIQKGTVKTEDFFNAIIKAGGSGTELAKLATEAKTVGQAMDGLKETIGNKLTPAFDVLSQIGIKAVESIAEKLGKIDGQKIAVKVNTFVQKALKCFEELKKFVSGVIKDFKKFGSAMSKYLNLGELFGGVKKAQPIWVSFRNVLNTVWKAIRSVFSFILKNKDAIKGALTSGIKIAKTVWSAFKSAVEKVGGAIMDVVKYIIANSDVFMDILATCVEAARPYWEAFCDVISWVIGLLKPLAKFIVDHAEGIKKLIPFIFAAIAGYKGFKVISGILPFVRGFTTSIGSLAKKLAGGLASKLFGVGKAAESTGNKSKTSSKNMLAAAKSMMMIGAAVLLIAAGFALLAQAAIALSDAGGLAIGVMAGLVIAVAGLLIGMMAMMKTVTTSPAKITKMAVAMIALGAAVVLISAGFWILSDAAIRLSDAGGLAVGVFAGMLIGIVAIIAVAGIFGSALSAGAVGFIALGAAILLACIGLAIAEGAIKALTPFITALGEAIALVVEKIGVAVVNIITAFTQLAVAVGSIIVQIVSTVVTGIVQIVTAIASGLSMIITSIGTAISQIILSISTLVVSIGTAISQIITSIAEGIATIISSVADGIATVVSAISEGLSSIITAFGELATAIGESVALVVESVGTTLVQVIETAGESIALVVTSICDGFATISGAVADVVTAISDGLSGVLESIAKIIESVGTAAKNAGEGFNLVAEGIKTIAGLSFGETIEALGTVGEALKKVSKHGDDLVKAGEGVTAYNSAIAETSTAAAGFMSAINSMIISVTNISTKMDKAATDAKEAGKKVGEGFTNSMETGLKKAPTVAATATTSITSKLRAGYAGAYSAGSYISQGFANGMLSCLGTIRNAAAQMAAAAQKAIEAKAKIASPSKVTTKLGEFFGEGFAIGISDKTKEAWRAAENLVSIPDLSIPDLALAYGGEMSADFDYYRNSQYTIEVPLTLDGKQVAKATATYTQEELNKRDRRNNRKEGRA